jgi:hypothetical protein
MPELWNHFPLEQMIICSFISRETLKTASFSENLFGNKNTMFKMEGAPNIPKSPEKCWWRLLCILTFGYTSTWL